MIFMQSECKKYDFFLDWRFILKNISLFPNYLLRAMGRM